MGKWISKIGAALALTVISASVAVAVPDDKKSPKPPTCPACKMALSAKKDKMHSKSVKIGKKTYYCCDKCKMDAPKPGKKAK